VLILGETGAGKEVLAEELHHRSPRAHAPFVIAHCAAMPESLIESALFGHEKGAFTGAAEQRPGLLESAQGGTVFLDEIGEVSLAMQPKLLRLLEERVILRVGGVKRRPVDVRFVAATNRDLEAEVAAGRFRQDLYFRLGAMVLRLPPLRARPSEIVPLAEMFLRKAAGQRAAPALSPEARKALLAHAWPGNVRELRNAMERAALLCPDGAIEPRHLALERASEPTPAKAHAAPAPAAASLRDDVSRLERQRIIDALESCAGNQSRAAEALGISRRTLIHKLEQFGLPRPRKARGQDE
jgi:DNA-binding NtrC family response regulator